MPLILNIYFGHGHVSQGAHTHFVRVLLYYIILLWVGYSGGSVNPPDALQDELDLSILLMWPWERSLSPDGCV